VDNCAWLPGQFDQNHLRFTTSPAIAIALVLVRKQGVSAILERLKKINSGDFAGKH